MVSTAVAVLLLFAAISVAFAQAPAQGDTPLDRFLDSHPQVAKPLAKKPELANDSHFVDTHPAFKAFLKNHRNIADDMHDNPGQYILQNGHYRWTGEHYAGGRKNIR